MTEIEHIADSHGGFVGGRRSIYLYLCLSIQHHTHKYTPPTPRSVWLYNMLLCSSYICKRMEYHKKDNQNVHFLSRQQ